MTPFTVGGIKRVHIFENRSYSYCDLLRSINIEINIECLDSHLLGLIFAFAGRLFSFLWQIEVVSGPSSPLAFIRFINRLHSDYVDICLDLWRLVYLTLSHCQRHKVLDKHNVNDQWSRCNIILLCGSM